MKVNDMKELLCPNVEVDRMLNELKEILPMGYSVVRKRSFLFQHGGVYIIEIYNRRIAKKQRRKWMFFASNEENTQQTCVARIILPIRDVSNIDTVSITDKELYPILKPFLKRHNCKVLYKCWKGAEND